MSLEAKEGLALINGTQLSTALAVLAWADACRVWEAAVGAAALSTEVLLGSFRPARLEVQQLRPYAGALEAARRLTAFAQDSALVASHANCGRVQDAYSMRCAPQVLGASWDAIDWVGRQLSIEVECVNDNPIVMPGTDEVLSAGLFHAQRLLDPGKSGLPAALAGDPGVESGYMMAQYTAAALVSENKVLAHPATVDSIPTGAGLEDHVSMAPIAGRHARAVVLNAARVVALELLCACRALEYRRPLTAGLGSEQLYAAVRRRVPAPEGDRPISEACEALSKWVLSPEPGRIVEEVLSA
jgi:histidine ammonia-lyase